jgi:hypothetical protein
MTASNGKVSQHSGWTVSTWQEGRYWHYELVRSGSRPINGLGWDEPDVRQRAADWASILSRPVRTN